MKYLYIFALCFVVGCSSAMTSVNADKEILRPPVYEGTLKEIHELAFIAAKNAFPEEEDIFKKENGQVIIERDWFWRGDTVIEVSVKQIKENKCIVEAESRANWHRLNGTILDVTEEELIHYLSTLQYEYKNYKRSNRLQELNRLHESGLISEEEYVQKKKQILLDAL